MNSYALSFWNFSYYFQNNSLVSDMCIMHCFCFSAKQGQKFLREGFSP